MLTVVELNDPGQTVYTYQLINSSFDRNYFELLWFAKFGNFKLNLS